MPAETSVGVLVAVGAVEVATLTDAVAPYDIAPATQFIQHFGIFTCGAGAGPYTAQVTLDKVDYPPANSSVMWLRFEFAASTNPTVQIYDNTGVGTLLATIVGQADVATVYVFKAVYNGSSWTMFEGGYVV